MHIQESGPVTERITLLGRNESCVYLVDGGGMPYGDHVFAAANSNFDLYQKSLEKMAALLEMTWNDCRDGQKTRARDAEPARTLPLKYPLRRKSGDEYDREL